MISVKVTRQMIEQFSTAVQAGVSSEVPGTFLTLFRQGEFELFQRLGVPLSKILHAEQEYIYLVPLQAEMEFEYETTLAQVLEKRGASGAMSFLTLETEFRSGVQKIATGRTTVVVR